MDLQIASMRADQTRRYPIPGLRINGHPKDLVLIVRWLGGSQEYQDAVTNKAFAKLNEKQSAAESLRLIAQHIVVGWDEVPLSGPGAQSPDVEGKPLAYTVERGVQVLSTFDRDQRVDKRNRFINFVTFGDNFSQSTIDADDLGNG